MRTGAAAKGVNLYPPYYKVLEEKELCIPARGIQVKDYSAEVGLQKLLDHTAQRLHSLLAADLETSRSLLLISKCGLMVLRVKHPIKEKLWCQDGPGKRGKPVPHLHGTP